MSRFQDPYLAESVGFATGHSNGIAQGVGIGRQQGYSNGLKDGYTQGWNAAADEANTKIAKQDKAFSDLNQKSHRNYNLMMKEIEKLNSKKETLKAEIDQLNEKIKFLLENNENLSNEKNLIQSKLETLDEACKQKHMAFLGITAMARAAIKVVASAPPNEQDDFLKHYATLAVELQTDEYITKNEFPHDQAIIIPHISDIIHLLKNIIFPRIIAYREKIRKDEENI